jgi:hypothetical protein
MKCFFSVSPTPKGYEAIAYISDVDGQYQTATAACRCACCAVVKAHAKLFFKTRLKRGKR